MKQFQFTDALLGPTGFSRSLNEAAAGRSAKFRSDLEALGVGQCLHTLCGYWLRVQDLEPEAPAVEDRDLSPVEAEAISVDSRESPFVNIPSVAERIRRDKFVLAIYPVVAEQYLAGRLTLEPGVSLTQCVVTNALELIAELETRS